MRGVDGVASSEELTNHFEAKTAIGPGNESDGHEVTLQGRFMVLVAQKMYSFSGGGCSGSLLAWRVRHWMNALRAIPTKPR